MGISKGQSNPDVEPEAGAQAKPETGPQADTPEALWDAIHKATEPAHDPARETEPDKPSLFKRLWGGLVGALVTLLILWFLVGGRVSYAISECSKGLEPCFIGLAVALGIVDVYDKNDRCIGLGCSY